VTDGNGAKLTGDVGPDEPPAAEVGVASVAADVPGVLPVPVDPGAVPAVAESVEVVAADVVRAALPRLAPSLPVHPAASTSAHMMTPTEVKRARRMAAEVSG
jgi:hypothetical protein